MSAGAGERGGQRDEWEPPASESAAPASQTIATPPTDPISAATVLGTRKIPLPIVMPMSNPAMLTTPSCRGNRSATTCVSLDVGMGWLIRKPFVMNFWRPVPP